MNLIRDILQCIDQALPISETVALRGRIASRTKAGKRIFLRLADPTGIMQAVYTRPDWAGAEPKQGERWELSGKIDSENFIPANDSVPTPTLVVGSGIQLTSPDGSATQTNLDIEDDEFSAFFRHAISLARLRSAAQRAFTKTGYLEIEPRLITLVGPTTGLEPLIVNYVGFGAAATLFPSPAPQLKQLLIATDVGALFSISRIFSTTYRDEATSYEALTAMGMRILGKGPAWDPGQTMRTICEQILCEPWLHESRLAHAIASTGWINSHSSALPATPTDPVPAPTIEIYEEIASGLELAQTIRKIRFARAIVPPKTVLAEQTLQEWYGEQWCETTTIHLERFSALIPDLAYRRMLVL